MSRADQAATKVATILGHVANQLEAGDRSQLSGHISAISALLPRLRVKDRKAVEQALETLRSLNVRTYSWHAIRTRPVPGGPWRRASLGKTYSDEPGKVYWWGRQWSDELPPEHEILKTYDLTPFLVAYTERGQRKHWFDMTALEIAFYQEYPREPQGIPSQATGFLGPNGGFYTCHWQEHMGLAEILVKCFHADEYHDCATHVSTSASPTDILKRHGWLLIRDHGYVHFPRADEPPYPNDYAITDDQRFALRMLASVGDERWQQNINRALRWAERPYELPDDIGEMD